MSGAAVRRVLDRVVGCRSTGEGKWIARCPAHEDKSPSLSIREMDDGRVLINCFAGCGAGDVLAAIGLCMADLFEKPLAHHLPPVRGGFSARELIELTSHEVTVATFLVYRSLSRTLTEEEWERLAQCSARLGKAQALVVNGR
jgi:hypothetical protein